MRCVCCEEPVAAGQGPLCPECAAAWPPEEARCDRCGLLLVLGAAGLCPHRDHPDGCFAPEPAR